MSSIVKAKWVTITNVSADSATEMRPEKQSDYENQSGQYQADDAESVVVQDDSVEAMRSANELMKEAIKASQEIKEKSQETGYQEGFAQGYAAGQEEGYGEGTQEGFQAGLKDGLADGLVRSIEETESKLQEINEVLELMKTERQSALERQEHDIMDVAFEIAKKIMKTPCPG